VAQFTKIRTSDGILRVVNEDAILCIEELKGGLAAVYTSIKAEKLTGPKGKEEVTLEPLTLHCEVSKNPYLVKHLSN
jgi:hypothetical protein